MYFIIDNKYKKWYFIVNPLKEVGKVEKRKPGRPKSDKPTRNKSVTMRLSENELNLLQTICFENRITYTDVLLKGLENWSRK